METNDKKMITVEVVINSSLEKVWKIWTSPEDIVHWYFASEDWHAPRAENDLKVGGKFLSRMEAKDGSVGFDFEGFYTTVIQNKLIEYVLADDRNVSIAFSVLGHQVRVAETFDPENEYPLEHQRAGWQAILDNFKKYVEGDYK